MEESALVINHDVVKMSVADSKEVRYHAIDCAAGDIVVVDLLRLT
jgi:hypothetical protein